ncbi:hypothetical protein Y032_0340g2982 [Ancylostoma ceylanicum]|uniref:FBA domain-containing protein n=1 Tax=Ancylostoma ceylanicum TaxID=53326 RepID=A0A016RY31_9BILA|nr:hypothetical protein Y032_0340g2982 [Ancylostoma ceylanicum]
MATLIKTITDTLTGASSKANSGIPFLANETIWFEILKRCDGFSLLRVEQTCSFFRTILTTSKFWIEKCEYDGVAIPSLTWRKFLRQELETSHDSGEPSVRNEFDYKRICCRRPFNRNLAVQLSSTSTLKALKKMGMVFRGGGDGIRIEHPPVYCEQTEVPVCFATSYGWCSRYFEIDLAEAGVEASSP